MDPKSPPTVRLLSGLAAAWVLVILNILRYPAPFCYWPRRFAPAIGLGLWSGLTSGLIACLMGLLLVAVWTPYPLRDPMNIREYAERGAMQHAL
jgi:hypothetical protein